MSHRLLRRYFVLPLIALLGIACTDAPASAPDLDPEELGPVASMIRNPVVEEIPDTNNIAKLVFAEEVFDFGEVKSGDVVEHRYAFTNTGAVPLIITRAKSSCGCTVPEYPKQPIAPGESGEILVTFNTTNKTGEQIKPVNLTANTYPATTSIYIKGMVN